MAGINLPIIAKFDDKGIKEAQSAFGGLGSSLGKIAGLVAAAFSVRAITNFAKESLAAAEGVQVANNRLDQIAKSMGIFGEQTQQVSDRLKSYAEANELTLATDAEVIKATQAKLLTFKELAGTADEAGGAFDRATQAAIDLAAAGFGTAETNAVQLGKALNDPIKGITALRRAGITFTESEKEKIAALVESGNLLEAQNVVLKAIETQVGGTAAATATASKRMALAFDNVKETVGAALMPAFASLAEAMIPIAEQIAPVLGDAITKLVPSFQEFAGFIPKVVEALVPLIPSLLDIAGAILDLAVELMPVFIEVLDTIIPILENLIPLFLDLFEQAIAPIIPAILDLVEALAPVVEEIFPLLAELLAILIPPLLILLEELFIPLIPVVLELIEAFMPLIEEVLPVLADILTTIVFPVLLFLADIFKVVLIGAIGLFQAGLEGLGTFVSGFATTFKNVWSGISSFMKGIINGILGFIQGLVNGVISGVNAVIRAINSLRFTIPSWVPGLGGQSIGFNLPTLGNVNIPRLAEGGVVMPQPGGVLANLAEAGQPEAVIPLDRFNGLGNKDVTYNITVNAGLGTDPVSLGREIVNAIKRYERTSGPVFAGA